MKSYTKKPLLIASLACMIFASCAQNSADKKPDSELLKKINAVHRQMMRQGNISEAEKEAIRALAALLPEEGIKDPQDSTSENYIISFQKVENIPTWSECEKLSGTEQKQCVTNSITEFINSEFDKSIAKRLQLSGNHAIEVFVKIDKYGYPSIHKVRDTNLELQAETVRVVNKLPRMAPASHNGENVAVIYPDVNDPHIIDIELE